jgi:hypothetical protein
VSDVLTTSTGSRCILALSARLGLLRLGSCRRVFLAVLTERNLTPAVLRIRNRADDTPPRPRTSPHPRLTLECEVYPQPFFGWMGYTSRHLCLSGSLVLNARMHGTQSRSITDDGGQYCTGQGGRSESYFKRQKKSQRSWQARPS